MKLGIFAKTFARPTVEEVFAEVARHGIGWVQFNLASAGLPSLPEAVPPAVCERILLAARRPGVGLAALSGTFNMIHPDPAQRRAGLRRFEGVTAAAAALCCPIVTLCTGSRDPADMWHPHPENATPAAWRDLVETMTVALESAERHGVVLGVEPELGNVVSSAARARRLLDELKSPRLRVILDPANLVQAGEVERADGILDEAFGLLGGDLVLAHAKELGWSGKAGGLAVGTGRLNWRHYFQSLTRAAFDGAVILHGFEEADAAASVRFARRVMEEIAG